jgi:hypothetical protein
MADLRSALRRAILAKFQSDATMQAFFPGNVVNMSYRPTRQPLKLPLITMFDFGDRGDDTVPLWDRNHQLDFWTTDLDVSEAMGQRAIELLDHEGLVLAGDEGLAARVHVVADQEAAQESADLARKTLRLRILAYDFVKTYENN